MHDKISDDQVMLKIFSKAGALKNIIIIKLIGSNEIVTYIPEYENIFDDENPQEQLFIAKILIENMKKKKTIEETGKSN